LILMQDPRDLGVEAEPKRLGSTLRTHYTLGLDTDTLPMGLDAEHNNLGV